MSKDIKSLNQSLHLLGSTLEEYRELSFNQYEKMKFQRTFKQNGSTFLLQ